MSADIRLLRWPDRQRDDYQRLATALVKVRAAAARARGELTVTVPAAPEEPSDLDRARTLLAQRRARDAAAGAHADLFAEPAWDMLLMLFVADGEGQPMLTDMLVTASSVARVAGLRWVASLAERGLVIVEADLLALTPPGRTLVARCISAS